MSEASGEIRVSRRHSDSAKAGVGSQQAEALYSLETLLMTGEAIPAAFEIRHDRTAGGDPVLSLHRIDDGTPLRFASICLECQSGRFYRTYGIGWGVTSQREERHYFTDAHDAAAYVGFLLTRVS
ncbi:hypothetical protein U8Q05_07095 [Rhizobium ruizarguesonis]|nr:hypothetical protein U8Q05_07095 [Rhizobium ruizarguesonis]